LSANGYDIFNRKEQGRIARPIQTKVLLGMNYDLKTTFILTTLWSVGKHISQKTKLLQKVITDLGIAYKFVHYLPMWW
jgi:iron complex outermembrane receptor protein